jgi:hypothetical protein
MALNSSLRYTSLVRLATGVSLHAGGSDMVGAHSLRIGSTKNREKKEQITMPRVKRSTNAQ